VKRYPYLADPLWLGACLLYAVNRGWWREALGLPFFTGQFNDLLLIPCALPVLLWVQRHLGLRGHDRFPEPGEVAFHLVVWSVIAEGIGPQLMPWAVSDLRDVVAYAVGGLLAGLWWHRRGTARTAAT
jgi:hypothetical protein